MAGIINTGSFASDLLPGVSTWFGMAYEQYKSDYEQIFEMVKSSRAFEREILASGLGLPQVKTEGGSVSYDSMGQGYDKEYTHVTYSNGFVITREMLEDGQSDVIAKLRTSDLAWSMHAGREVVAANVLNRAFNSVYAGGDGKELCATNHPTKADDLKNELTTPADLSEAALEQVLIDIMDFRNDRGLRIAVQGMKLIVPKELSFEAHRILNTNLRPGTANNDANSMKDMGMLPGGVCVNRYLTDADAFFIKTDVPNGLKFYERRGVELGTENDFDTENARFKATMRFSVGWTDPRGIFGSPGAS